MEIRSIAVGRLAVNCFVVGDSATKKAMVIDPGDESERIIEFIDSTRFRPEQIILTHAHYDHACAAGDLKKHYKAQLLMHEEEAEVYLMTKKLCISWGYEEEDFPQADRLLTEGDTIAIGSLSFRVMHVPGHTPGGICIYGYHAVFTGDTLFAGSVGRTDLPGGSTEKLFSSLRKIIALPPHTKVYSGHGDATTIAEEIQGNPFIKSLQ